MAQISDKNTPCHEFVESMHEASGATEAASRNKEISLLAMGLIPPYTAATDLHEARACEHSTDEATETCLESHAGL